MTWVKPLFNFILYGGDKVRFFAYMVHICSILTVKLDWWPTICEFESLGAIFTDGISWYAIDSICSKSRGFLFLP